MSGTRTPQTDRGVVNQRSGEKLRRRCTCGRTIIGNAAWWSHQNAAANRGDESAHRYNGRA